MDEYFAYQVKVAYQEGCYPLQKKIKLYFQKFILLKSCIKFSKNDVFAENAYSIIYSSMTTHVSYERTWIPLQENEAILKKWFLNILD